MNFAKRKSFMLCLIVMCVFSMQLISMTGAHALTASPQADDPTDLAIYVDSQGLYHSLFYQICNNGTTTVTGFTVNNVFDGFTPTEYIRSIFTNPGSTGPGTINSSTGEWTGGQMLAGECLGVVIVGTRTAGAGQTVSFSSTITQATLEDDSINVDTNPSNDTSSLTSPTLAEDPDITLGTRLLTSGTITPGEHINYELSISSIGLGDYYIDPGHFGGDEPSVYFLMPTGASYVNLTDTNQSDILDITDPDNACQDLGDINNFGPSFDIYDGNVIACHFNVNSGDYLPTGNSYTFNLELIATSEFESGTTQVRGVVVGGDPDTTLFFAAETKGEDFFGLDSNNIVHLTFDNSELIPTVNPCAGQGTTISVNDACFTISFNKDIYGPSFTADDLVLTGGGTISSFAETSTGVWTVHVTGMTPGGTLTVSLAEGGIQDLSAVSNGVQVLGINTVRYQTTTDSTGTTSGSSSGSTSANGTLAQTGKHVDWFTPVILLIIGLGLLQISRRKTTWETPS